MSPDLEDELRELIRRAQGAEQPDIEFKAMLELRTIAQKAELAKDVALQANLPSGGNLLFGFDNTGTPIGLPSPIVRDDVARVLAGRLMFAPLNIEIRSSAIRASTGDKLNVLWVKVGANPYAIPTAFLATDGSWKVPIRVDTVTRYLSPVEAIALYRTREPETPPLGPRFLPVSFNAEPDSVVETLDSNLFPFVHTPQVLWAGRTEAEVEDEVRALCGKDVPPFRLWRGQIVCLREYDESESIFSSAIRQPGRLLPARDFLRQRDARRVMIGLLNKELISYAVGIPVGGPDAVMEPGNSTNLREHLVFDEEAGRLYFPPLAGKPWKCRWQAFQRQGTRTVVGVKLRPDGSVRHWDHFGMRLRIEDLGRTFALLIEPTWIFTKDGVAPLPSYRIVSVATRKMGLEDNARILYNVHFWARLLSQGAPRISLPLGGGGAIVSREPIRISLKGGIAADLVTVPDASVDLDAEVDEILPVETESEEERDRARDWSFGT